MNLIRIRNNLVYVIILLIFITPLTTAIYVKTNYILNYDDVIKEKPDAIVNGGLFDLSWIKYYYFPDRLRYSQSCIVSNFVCSEWIKTFGGPENDRGFCVHQTLDGGYIIAGTTESYGIGKKDVWLIKVDGEGGEQWNKTFGGVETDSGYSVWQTVDSGYIITGVSDSYDTDYDIWLVKTDANGNEQWNKTYGGTKSDSGRSVQQTLDGGYIITGLTCSFAVGETDIWIVKTDLNGNEQWNKTKGTVNDDVGFSVDQTDDGGYIIVGETYPSFSRKYDVWLIKLDANGNDQWSKSFGGINHDYGQSVQQTMDGGYVFAGSTSSYSISENRQDVWLVKTDASGNELWNKTYGGKNSDLGFSMQQTSDGGYIITGITDSFGAGDYDFWLIKTDNNGNKLWDKTFGGPDVDKGKFVQQTSDGGYILTGYTGPNEIENYDILLIKAAAFENQRPSPPIIMGPSNGKKYENVNFFFISTDPDNNDLYYYIDWGDHQVEEWLGPRKSDVQTGVNHSWYSEGTFTVKAKAKDIYGGESDWSEFEIKISNPRTKSWLRFFDMFPILQKILNYIL